MCANDDTVSNLSAGYARKLGRHERRRLTHCDDTEGAPGQPPGNGFVLNGALDQMMRRSGFDGAAGNGQKMSREDRRDGQDRSLNARFSGRSSSTAP